MDLVEQLLLLFQALFLVLLYLFIWRVIRTASRDLRVPQESFVLAPSAPVPPAPALAPALSPLRVLVIQSPALSAGETFAMNGPVTLGRSPDNTVVLESDEFASAHHARIDVRSGEAWIFDLESRNGTFVNGRRVEGRSPLRPRDVVRVGATDLRVEA